MRIIKLCFATFAFLIAAMPALAQSQCDAWFPFDGNLTDASGNGNDGTMIGKGGVLAHAQFSTGVVGQALQVDGSSAMRAYVDLNPDACPQITITAWIRVESNDVNRTQFLISTGAGNGPGLRSSGTIAVLTGNGNGLMQRDALRDGRAWFFFAGVYDYKANTYQFHWRDRIVEGKLAESHRAPEDALWVGAYNDQLSHAFERAYVDELRITGRTLTAAELARMRGGRPGAFVMLDGATDTNSRMASGTLTGSGIPQPVPGISERLGTNVPRIDADDLPERRPDLLNSAASDSGPLLEVPPELEAARSGTTDPNLTLPENDPATQLQESLQAIPDRPPPTPRVDEIFCDFLTVPNLKITSNATFPQRFMNALDLVANCGYYPQVVVLNDKDQWIISAGDQIAHSTNLPGVLAQKLDEFENTHGQLDAADISSDGNWLIVAGNEYAESGIPLGARLRALSLTNAGNKVVSFSINPGNSDQWLMVDKQGNVYGESIPWQINAANAQFPESQNKARQARFMPNGSWILFGRDHWYISDGLTKNQLRNINVLRNNRQGVEHFLGYKKDGVFLLLSNGSVAANPFSAVSRFENSLGANANLNIWSRMAQHGVTGVAIAVVRNDQVEWTRGYGLRDSRDLESFVRPDTTFDVASVSKAVSAFALMQLAQDGLVDIVKTGGLEDIEGIIPASELAQFRENVIPESGNIIQTLQHCGGFCYGFAGDCHAPDGAQGGAKGYPVDRTPPTTAEVIMGTSPAANGNRLVRTGDIGARHRYTTGNYNLIQGLIDVHAGSFVSYTDQLFATLGMTSSTFASPFPDRNGNNFARGHEKGAIRPMFAYGELAGASLVSTAADMAQFVIELNRGGQDLLSESWHDRFVGRDPDYMQYCNKPGAMALGINRDASNSSWNNREVIWHHGVHNGYTAKMISLPGARSGIVIIMTGHGDDTEKLYSELKASFKLIYGI